jgi:hypothetical protein
VKELVVVFCKVVPVEEPVGRLLITMIQHEDGHYSLAGETRDPPVGGYFRVVLECPINYISNISDPLARDEAEAFSLVLNSLPEADALLVATHLLRAGCNDQIARSSLSRSQYAGRSFDRNMT